ncbi:MAG: NAD-dependent succinate-semialdehyde dehydrogenase [Candidatus Sericytochromatia bacterium]
MALQTLNPTTGEAISSYPEISAAELQALLERVEGVWQTWKQTPFATRSQLMHRAAQLLRTRKQALALLMAQEMGKPLSAGEAEAEKCAWVCEYYADGAEAMLADQAIEAGARSSYVRFQPLGPVLAIMPWNFPLWQVFRFAAPALMAGNAALLKHAEIVQGCAAAIEAIFVDAGFPAELFCNLVISHDQTREVIEHPVVRAVTLTGSTRAGKTVAAQAGAVLKKTVLELGGSDPYLILADADLDHAAQVCATSRLINGGQSCIAAKRFIVVESVKTAFETKLVEAMGKAVMGDPLDPATTLGPQARGDLRDALHAQVEASLGAGARCLLGGQLPEGPGFFYPPTVLTDVGPGMPAYEDELFGPVAAIIGAADEAEAIAIANDTVYGLGAAVFSQDLARAEQIAAEQLEAGCCFVNALVASDPRLPFGGIKESGYGRELADFGIREFVNIKTVFVK